MILNNGYRIIGHIPCVGNFILIEFTSKDKCREMFLKLKDIFKSKQLDINEVEKILGIEASLDDINFVKCGNETFKIF